MSDPNPVKLVFSQDSAVALTGTGSDSETTLLTFTVPADRMGSRGYLKIKAWYSATNGNNNKTLKIKFGSDVYVTKTTTTATGTLVECVIKNVGSYAVQSGVDQAGTITAGTAATNANVTVTVTGQLAVTTQTMTLEGLVAESAYL